MGHYLADMMCDDCGKYPCKCPCKGCGEVGWCKCPCKYCGKRTDQHGSLCIEAIAAIFKKKDNS